MPQAMSDPTGSMAVAMPSMTVATPLRAASAQLPSRWLWTGRRGHR